VPQKNRLSAEPGPKPFEIRKYGQSFGLCSWKKTEGTKVASSQKRGVVLNNGWEKPFESIEGAQEYMRLLAEAVRETRLEVEADISNDGDPHKRRLQALRIVSYKLEKLEQHMKVSQRLLNDLRSLRRLLFEERGRPATSPTDLDTTPDKVWESEPYW
jgi:hypothetical protein